MRKFDFYLDSSNDLPQEVAAEFDFRTIFMQYVLDGKEYTEDFWKSVSAKSFYDALRAGKTAQTSQPSHARFIEIFSQSAEKGRDVLFMPLSSKISGTCENARGAARELSAKFPERQFVVADSINATMGHGLLAISASKAAAAGGLTAAETGEWVKSRRDKFFALFTVDDLMFLHRGGRLGKFSAIAGGLLGIKPVLDVHPDGHLQLKGKVRGRRQSLDWLAANMGKCLKSDREFELVTIAHGDCPDDAAYLEEKLRRDFTVERIITTTLGPVIGAHSGPGTVALFFEGDITREEFEKLK